jgi:hypothetical protein
MLDTFELKLRAESIALVDRMKVDRRALGISRVGLFAATLYRLLIERRERYSVLVSAGTSGVYMQELAHSVFRLLNVKAPPFVLLPIVRFAANGALFDNSPLLPEVQRQLGTARQLDRVLFVDDEIKRGTTACACFDLLLRSGRFDFNRSLDCTIVAENHFFEWPWDRPRVAVRYLAPARLLYGLEHNIAHCLPDDLVKKARRHFDPMISHHELMALVVGGAVKRMRDDVPFYDQAPARSLASRITDYATARKKFLQTFQNWAESGLRRYRDGSLRFRF